MHILPYMLPVLLTASAASIARSTTEHVDDIMVYRDGPTADGSAGIGVELESPFFKFAHPGCSMDNTNAAKKAVVDKRQGTNWLLTADTGVDPGKLNAEFIFDGQKIKVGTGELAKAGKAAADDLVKWYPWQKPQTEVQIANNKCNPWKITSPTSKDKPDIVPWDPQVTAPMPLEALYSIMQMHKDNKAHVLNGIMLRTDYSILVTKLYFTPVKEIKPAALSDDVLAFCSLVLSYAKSLDGKPLKPDESPKLRTPFMPRNDFVTLYNQVESKLKGIPLLPLFEKLACYKVSAGKLALDKKFCTGTAKAPVPNKVFAGLTFKNTASKSPDATLTVKAWIEGIAAKKDLLTAFDKTIDGSIGGLGSKTEKMYQGTRNVPLFEFRDLKDITTSGIEKFMVQVDTAIQDLHKKYKVAPK
ncbi:hypothetical protein BDV38DRAFT_289176 [Aspergillus pseudotamarii]|uniref:Uncharacterized protein n=1 Tax=Aspergillus pseudotamarii TaxID=132259 RepID=A0A5N6SB53_ASPPS|nr:uncharacterized protein BDV38DRAFT_289176 [Aspergillus pseudotamarii]KAE8130920.1 hypothetical protein BDV38DRAFT_289176 [Aspergillus pseudotamarii]